MAAKKPIIALMYDFDKTLCTTDMQAYTFIPNLGMSADAFWKKASDLAENKKMDRILAYMYLMLDEAHIHRQPIRRSDFVALGKDLKLYDGVEGWFGRINQFGKEQGVVIKHYIISSGLREIIEGSSIFKEFDDVFAGEFLYDENGVACWPKNVVNYTTKTQYLFRINKGVLNLSNDDDLNRFKPEEDRPVPFRNMIYIGDGLTDVPCMKLVKVNGGYSIAVYQAGKRNKVKDLIKDQRVNFIEPTDYSENSQLDIIVKDIIRNMASVERLKAHTKSQLAGVNK